MEKKSKKAKQSEGRNLTVRRTLIGERYATARTAIKAAATVAGLYVAKDMVIALSGEETIVAVSLAFLGDIKSALLFIAAVFGLGWGATERRLRHSTVDRLHKRVKDLELGLDPNRTSSGLTTEGKTHPMDLRR